MISKDDMLFICQSNITLKEIWDELEYRDNSNGLKWNDDLYEFEIEELEELTQILEPKLD